MTESQDLAALLRDVWGAYGQGKVDEALARLRPGVERFPDEAEVHYALGMANEKAGNPAAARTAFARAVEILDRHEKRAGRTMLRRLAQGHINRMERGVWDLEAETWQRQ
jgi:Flp pilus assembly protein TadD